MKWRPLSAKEKGFTAHLVSIGVNPDQIRTMFGMGKTNKEIHATTGHSEHTIGRWKNLWKKEQEDALRALEIVKGNKP